MRRCTGYPHQGTWSAGGYWDADHLTLSGSNVTGAASREGSAVLAPTGVPTQVTDPIVGGKVVTFALSSVNLGLIDNTHWGNFTGTAKEFIAFVQYTSQHVLGGGRLMALGNAGSGNRVIDLYTTNTPINFGRFEGTHNPIVSSGAVAIDTRYTMVIGFAGGSSFLIDAGGTHTTADTIVGALAPTRFYLNGQDGSSGQAGMYYKRWGIKLPATSNTLTEAVDLRARLLELAL